MCSLTGMVMKDCLDIGYDYALTLRAWRKRFLDRRSDILSHGYTEEFIRKYEFYFAYCEAAFEQYYLHDFILTWRKEAGTGNVSKAYSQGSAYSTAAAFVGLVALFSAGVCLGRYSDSILSNL